ncbi:TPA: DUF5455 family protein [Escherichia coli]|nr:DUF5455 family protein [Escherichia coli]
MSILLTFIAQLLGKFALYVAGFFGRSAAVYSRLVVYLAVCFSAYIGVVKTANELIYYISAIGLPDAVVIGFSYLPTNIQACVNIILNVEFIAFIYLYKDRVLRLIDAAWKEFIRMSTTGSVK